MNNTRLLFGLFCAAALAQLGVPAWMIAEHERTLATGERFLFRTRPVDPYDAFRGRYVALSFEQGIYKTDDPGKLRRGLVVFALLESDEDGFARIAGLSESRPDSGAYIKTRIRDVRQERRMSPDGREREPIPGSWEIRLELPFERFYMEERLAPEAERVVRERSGAGRQDAYIAVRVRSGIAVIEDLFVGGKPIREFFD